jgi:hypothetical protein
VFIAVTKVIFAELASPLAIGLEQASNCWVVGF